MCRRGLQFELNLELRFAFFWGADFWFVSGSWFAAVRLCGSQFAAVRFVTDIEPLFKFTRHRR